MEFRTQKVSAEDLKFYHVESLELNKTLVNLIKKWFISSTPIFRN